MFPGNTQKEIDAVEDVMRSGTADVETNEAIELSGVTS